MRSDRTRSGFIWKATIGIVVAAGLAIAAWQVVATQSNNAADDLNNATVLGVADVRTFEISTLSTGDLEAKNQIEIRNEVEGQTTITWIAPEGERVAKGDKLVELNDEEIEEKINNSELEVEQAKSDTDAARTALAIQESDNATKLQKAKLDFDLAELDLKKWREGDHEQSLQDNRLAIDRAERELVRLRAKYENSQELFAQKFLSKDELDTDHLAYIEAQAALSKANLASKIYNEFTFPKDEQTKMSAVDQARDQLDRTIKENEINLNNKRSALRNRERQLELRTEKFNELKDQLAKCIIYAPSDGLVVYGSTADRDDWRWRNEGPIGVGRQIRTNDLLIVLPDTSEMVASVKVHESLARRVRPGQRAVITIEAASETVTGTVDSIGVLAEQGGWRDPNRREYTVKIAIDPTAATSLKPSMRCEARIILGDVDDSLSVPIAAVFNDGQVHYVCVPEGRKFKRVPVKVGRRSDLYAEITGGLDAATRVLLREPSSGEMLEGEWTDSQLELAGYQRDESGTPVRIRGNNDGRAGRPAQGGQPAAATTTEEVG